MDRSNKKVDVVIPTYKPDKNLRILLEQLNRQTIVPDKIILINTDKKYLQESFAGISNVIIHHILPSEFDHAATRHKGILMSESEYVIFMTQDAFPADDRLIEELLYPFRDEKVAVSYARQLPKEDCNVVEKYTRSFNYPDYDLEKSKEKLKKMGIKTYFCSDVCAAYRVNTYIKLGGFVKRTIFNEDSIYAAKVVQTGYKVYYSSGAKVIHSHNYTALQYFKRNFDLGVSHKEYSSVFEGIHSEEEGVKLVLSTAKYLTSIKKAYLIPGLIIKSGFKYIGYRLGRNYNKLPMWLVKNCTASKRYWEV